MATENVDCRLDRPRHQALLDGQPFVCGDDPRKRKGAHTAGGLPGTHSGCTLLQLDWLPSSRTRCRLSRGPQRQTGQTEAPETQLHRTPAELATFLRLKLEESVALGTIVVFRCRHSALWSKALVCRRAKARKVPTSSLDRTQAPLFTHPSYATMPSTHDGMKLCSAARWANMTLPRELIHYETGPCLRQASSIAATRPTQANADKSFTTVADAAICLLYAGT